MERRWSCSSKLVKRGTNRKKGDSWTSFKGKRYESGTVYSTAQHWKY